MGKKRILITGSNGMLGTELAALLRSQYEIIRTDITEKVNPYFKDDNFIKCDITDKTKIADLIKKSKFDLIVHAAAWTDVDGCELERDKAFAINSDGTYNVALGAKEAGAILFYLSSDFVFDGEKNEPYKETDLPNPINVYGESKLRGEQSIAKALENYAIVRTSWLFGQNGRNFVDIILSLVEKDKKLKVVIDQFGSPTYVKDLVLGLENLIASAFKDKSYQGIYHFSNSGSCSWYKYAEKIIRLSNKRDVEIIPITSTELDRPAKRPKMSILNIDKYSLAYNKNVRNWEAALEEYLYNNAGREENVNIRSSKK